MGLPDEGQLAKEEDLGTGRRRARRAPSESKSGHPSFSDRIIRWGAIAAAITATVGLVSGAVHWVVPWVFPGGEAKSARLTIEGISPRPFGGWLADEQIPPVGFSRKELDAPGIKVTYDLTTSGFGAGAELPVSLLVTDVDGNDLAKESDSFTLDRKSDSCDGCSDWIRLDLDRGTVSVDVRVYRPGAREDPIAGDTQAYCPRSRRPGAC